jgi:hypothetical protein
VISGDFSGTANSSDPTANAYKEDKWNDEHWKSAVPYNPGSPNDDGVTQKSLKESVIWLIYKTRIMHTFVPCNMISTVVILPQRLTTVPGYLLGWRSPTPMA